MTSARTSPESRNEGGITVALLTVPCRKSVLILRKLRESGICVSAVVLQQAHPVTRVRRYVGRLGWRMTIRLVLQRIAAELTTPSMESFYRDAVYRSGADDMLVVTDLNSSESQRVLSDLNADVGIVGCSGLLVPEVFRCFRLGVLNMHPGITPMYRGRNPIEWAVLDDGEIGVTLHYIDQGIDTGPVVSQRRIEVEAGDTFDSLYRRAEMLGIDMLLDYLTALNKGQSIELHSFSRGDSKAHGGMSHSLRQLAKRRLHERGSLGARADARTVG